ncbi:MAG: SIR2 family protein, partial [Alcaligenaceae bacterium]
MREVTEGRAFDAIIENEYRSIADDDARELYGLICAFTRSRSLVRDQLCSDALDRPITDIYAAMSEGLDGIVVWETVDAARGIEALRARHQVIADIVWDRCLQRLDREKLLMLALEAINLSFGVDSRAFEAFTRDDRVIDSLDSLESKTRFFEEACRKDPKNAYIRQHYARMLRREGKVELALSQIETAIRMAPDLRVLHHTHGVILRDAAMHAANVDVAHRRIAQSEEAFRGAIRRAPRDEYAYQSLAELYLDWARRTEDAAESVSYLARAQEVVSEGLISVRNGEGLYVVASRIEDFLGDGEARIVALRNALLASPSSPVVRYLLGNALRRDGK